MSQKTANKAIYRRDAKYTENHEHLGLGSITVIIVTIKPSLIS
jgi:hypothetical protein